MTKEHFKAVAEAMDELSSIVGKLDDLWQAPDEAGLSDDDRDQLEYAHGHAKFALDDIRAVVARGEGAA